MAFKIPVVLAAILVFSDVAFSDTDYTVKYYATVNLTCDSLSLNVSDNMNRVDKLYWILSSGKLVDKDSDLPRDMTMSDDALHLSIGDIKDETFGYYHCIILYKDTSVKTIRFGVNVDGPDFSDLHEQYRHNAMVGGIAAAVLLALIGSGCIIWHFRFRHEDDVAETLHKPSTDDPEISPTVYDNEIELEEKKVAPEEKANGTFDERF